MRDRVYIIGGGTVAHVRPHLALCAPAYGTVIHDLTSEILDQGFDGEIHAYATRMAGGYYTVVQNGIERGGSYPKIETNEDVSRFVDMVIADPRAKILFMPVALCDFEGSIIDSDGDQRASGKDQPRLKSDEWRLLRLDPAEKVIAKIRAQRKDLFLVGFKSTTGLSPQEQFEAGLGLVKRASCNLVLANDLHTKLQMVVTPEESAYEIGYSRRAALKALVKIALARSEGTFTRSTLVDGESINWTSPVIPASLRTVVDHLIARGAYKPFNGKTAGHFAFKLDDGRFITSKRKTNFNDLKNVGMVLVESQGDDKVIAYGARPSVGGQSQRIIFREHVGVDAIAHAHVRRKVGSPVPVVDQWPNECGSHQCGKNTSNGLTAFPEYDVKAVMLDNHGPNVVFNKNADPAKVIEFFERNFDLDKHTSEIQL